MNKAISLLLVGLAFAFAGRAPAQEVIFTKSKQVIQEGDKSRQRDVALAFLGDKVVVRDRKANQVYAEIPNASLNDLTYELSKHPRYKTAIFLSPLALFSPGKKHWLTIEYQTEGKTDFVLLQLDKGEYQRIIATAEARTGKDVKRILED